MRIFSNFRGSAWRALRPAAFALLGGVLLQNSPAETADNSGSYTWRNVKILAGGFIPGIEFSLKESGLAYCRTDMGGAYRWDATAGRWIPLTDWAGPSKYNLMGIESIAIDPVDPKKVYIAAGMYSGNKAAILRSSDQGNTFDTVYVPFSMGGNQDGRGVGERLAIDPNQPATLYFGSRFAGLWVSKDSAVTWSEVGSFPFKGSRRARGSGGAGISFVLFDPASGSPGNASKTLFVGLADHQDPNLYRSDDAGETWTKVPGQPAPDFMPRHGALDAVSRLLYLNYGNGAGPNGVTDGAVWKLDLKSGVWTNISPVTPHASGEGGFGYGGLSLDQQHPGTLMVATLDRWGRDDVFRSVDAGKSWHGILAQSQRDAGPSPYLLWGRGSPALGWWIDALAIDPFDSNHVLYATGATVWGCHDITALDSGHATHWTPEVEGIEQTAVVDLISPPSGAHLISGLGDICGFVHDDLTVSPPQGMMDHPRFSTTNSLDFAENKPAIIARVGEGGNGEFGGYSNDGGAHWTPFPRNNAQRGGGKIAVSADGGSFVWTPPNGPALFSKDEGKTWTPCQGLPAGSRPISDRVNPAKFYALDLSRQQLYLSADGGATFTGSPLKGFAPAGNSGFTVRAVAGHEGDLWLCSRGVLYQFHSADNSFVAHNQAGRVITFGLGKAAPGHDYPALYIAATLANQEGIFRSDDAGQTWSRLNDDRHQYGAPSPVIGDPRIYGRVYFGTNGRGIIYGDLKGSE